MAEDRLRCCFLGGRDADLYTLGEVHKCETVEIAFVFDTDANAVGLEIAEILGIDRLSDPTEVAGRLDLDYAIVSEPRDRYRDQLEVLASAGVKVLSHGEALRVLCGREPSAPARQRTDDEPYSIDDALAAFERLFDRKQLLKFLLDVAVEASHADAGSIMMYSTEQSELYIAYATGLSERVVRNTRQKIGEGIAGTVAQERKGRLIRDARRGRLYDRDRTEIHSAISVSLEWRNQLIGVLNVSSATEERPLTDDGLRALERLAPRIARLLYEASRLQETQIRHQEMNLRQSVGELSEKAMSPAAKFSMISNLLSELLGADTVEIFVGTHEGDWLVLGGSNRRVATKPDMIKCDRGAMSRAYLERTSIVMTEASSEDSGLMSSYVFVPLGLAETVGVLGVEFGDRNRLEEFLVIKESVALELARFIASEKRERRLRRDINALSKVSDSAPSLLSTRTVDELCELLSRLVADALDCERVSVRLQADESAPGRVSRFEGGVSRSARWAEEDEERFLRLRKKQQSYTMAFLDFQTETPESSPAYHSLLAVPIELEGRFSGGVIAYDKRPANALEEATFTDLDESIVDQVISIAVPVLRTIMRGAAGAGTEEPSYDGVLGGNMQRMKKILEGEMSRSDRYHHAFSLLVLRLEPIHGLFEKDYTAALGLVDEITRGVQTRTRKTDYGCWVRRDTFVMISLEGTRRIRFLISRLMLYLLKDFSAAGLPALEASDVLVGQVIYPGASRTPEALIAEAEAALAPFGDL